MLRNKKDWPFELVLKRMVDTKEQNEIGKKVQREIIQRTRGFSNGSEMHDWAVRMRPSWKFQIREKKK